MKKRNWIKVSKGLAIVVAVIGWSIFVGMKSSWDIGFLNFLIVAYLFSRIGYWHNKFQIANLRLNVPDTFHNNE